MLTSSRTIGRTAENFVCNYLQDQGLKLVATNYQCKYGEIDLIMREAKTLVFIEVRYRKKQNYGDGIATVTKTKQYKIMKTAVYYLQKNKLYDKILCRFDVVATSGKANGKIVWIKDAFWKKW